MTTTHHKSRNFVFTIEYQAGDSAFTVTFPDLPAVMTSGDTLASAFANACEALDLHLESLQKLGKRTPKAKHSLVVESV